MAHPQKISKGEMSLLQSIIEKYPYFQSARALQLKGLKNENSFLYNDALKLTAAYTTDRNILFEYITSDAFVQNEISQTILQHSNAIKEIEVIIEDISESISSEIDKQIKLELNKATSILDPDLFERKVTSVSQQVKLNKEENEKPLKIQLEATKETATTILEINNPLEFRKNDTHSFAEWLKLTRAKPIVRSANSNEELSIPKAEIQEEKERKYELIEKFIQKKPRPIPKEIISLTTVETHQNKNLADPYIQNPSSLMTETLAKVYLQQKNYNKAIHAYKILILKYPEKSGFFADQIRAIQKLINT